TADLEGADDGLSPGTDEPPGEFDRLLGADPRMGDGVYGDYGILVSKDRLGAIVQNRQVRDAALSRVPRTVVRECVRGPFVCDRESRTHSLVRLLIPRAECGPVEPGRHPQLPFLSVGPRAVRAGLEARLILEDAGEGVRR